MDKKVNNSDPLISLAAAVVAKAVEDAMCGDLDAICFLRGDFDDYAPISMFAEPLEIDADRIQSWAMDLDLAYECKPRQSKLKDILRKNGYYDKP